MFYQNNHFLGWGNFHEYFVKANDLGVYHSAIDAPVFSVSLTGKRGLSSMTSHS